MSKSVLMIVVITLCVIAVSGWLFLPREWDSSLVEAENVTRPSDTATAVPNELADEANISTEATLTDGAILNAEVKSKDGTLIGEALDMFVVNADQMVGYDSWYGRDLGSSRMKYSEDNSLAAKVFRLDEYDKNVEVVLVGRADTDYLFEGVMVDENAQSHDFSYAGKIGVNTMITYSFNSSTGVVTESNIDRAVIEKYPTCEAQALQQQLKELLNKHHFNTKGLTLEFDKTALRLRREVNPFVFKEEGDVCTWEIGYSHATSSIQVSGPEVEGLKQALSAIYEPLMADGPLGSSETYRIPAGADSFQVLAIHSGASIIPVAFPFYYTCPCAEKITISLTAPLNTLPR